MIGKARDQAEWPTPLNPSQRCPGWRSIVVPPDRLELAAHGSTTRQSQLGKRVGLAPGGQVDRARYPPDWTPRSTLRRSEPCGEMLSGAVCAGRILPGAPSDQLPKLPLTCSNA